MRAIAFTPDGRTLATGARTAEAAEGGGEVKLWGTENGKLARTLTVEGSDVNALTFSPDGRVLVGTGLKAIWCWDARTGELKHTMPSESAVLTVAFSPDGRTLASGSFDQQVRLWDATKWEVRRTLKGHQSEVRAVAVTLDGKTVAAGGVGELLIWDARTGERVRTLKVESTVWAIALSPDGACLAAGYGDPKGSAEGGIRVWDVASGELRRKWAARGGAVGSLAFSPDGRTLASGRFDGTATLWDVAKRKPGK